MKNKSLVIVLILAIILLVINTTSYAANDSYSMKIIPNKTSLKTNESVLITVRLEDIKIESGEKGIGSYEAVLEYDKNSFEFVNITSAANWDSAIFNSATGKFASVRSDSLCSSENQDVAIIELKTKTSINNGTTNIKLKNIGCSNFDGIITTSDVTTQINLIQDSPVNPNQNTTGSTNQNTATNNNSTTNKNNSTIKNNSLSNYPAAGKSSFVILSIFVFIITAIGTILYKNSKKY